MPSLKFSILVDSVATLPFCAEFGLSLFVSYGNQRYLFDTGAGHALAINAPLLGIELQNIEHVILSHGHSDHSAGLALLNPQGVYCAPGIDCARVSAHPGRPPHSLSMPADALAVLARSERIAVSSFCEIANGLFLTGPIPRLSKEDCGGNFFFDMECTKPDFIQDEQALLLDNGTLITGCCHAGIINTIEFCRLNHPEIRISTIIGGLHLLHADENRLAGTADYLRSIGISRLFPLHCTCDQAIAFLQDALPDTEIIVPKVGDTVTI